MALGGRQPFADLALPDSFQDDSDSPSSSWAAVLLGSALAAAFAYGAYYLYHRERAIQERKRDEQIRWWVLASVFASAFGAILGALYKMNLEHYRRVAQLRDHQRQYRQIGLHVAVVFSVVLALAYRKYQSSKSGGSGLGIWNTLS